MARSLQLATLVLACITMQAVSTRASQSGVTVPAADDKSPWRIIASLFEPPPDFRNQFGEYRSPLQFADGSLARTPADWARRRREILHQWRELMGPWPRVLKRPKVE